MPVTSSSCAKTKCGLQPFNNGVCRAVFAQGWGDTGNWGLTEDGYWTQYQGVRDGEWHALSLVPIAHYVVQAYHANGEPAFLQTPLPELPPDVLLSISKVSDASHNG